MNINAFGTDIFLRFTIRSRLAKLKQDDQVCLRSGHLALRKAGSSLLALSAGHQF